MVKRGNKKFNIKILWEIIKKSASGFMDDKLMKLSAALSYYTIFSMGPRCLL